MASRQPDANDRTGGSGFDPRADRLAIIAGNGAMPGEIRDGMLADGNDPLVIGIRGEVDAALAPDCEAVLGFGQLGSLFDLLQQHQIRHVLFAGGIVRRPDFRAMKLDLVTLKELPSLLKIVLGGDDSVLGKIATFMARRDIEVVGTTQVAPGMLAGEGVIAGPALRGRMPRDLAASAALAWKAAKLCGELDAGQGAIVEDGRVVALEGAEGTDQMVERLGVLRQAGRLNPGPKWSILAKTAKPRQDMRADLPSIGPQTIETASGQGINVIVVEAGRSVVLQRERLETLAKQYKIRVIGLADGAVA